MPFDVFGLRDHVVDQYRDYVESFIYVRNARIESFLRLLMGRDVHGYQLPAVMRGFDHPFQHLSGQRRKA